MATLGEITEEFGFLANPHLNYCLRVKRVTSEPSQAARGFILVPSTPALFLSIFDRPKINIAEASKNPWGGGEGAVFLSVSPYMALITIVLGLNIPLL